MEINLGKHYKKLIKRTWFLWLIAVPSYLWVNLGFLAEERNILLILGAIVFTFFFSFTMNALDKIRLSDAVLTHYWTSFRLKFGEQQIKRNEVTALRIRQLPSRHYALLLALKSGQEIVLVESPNKSTFLTKLDKFWAQIDKATFFENIKKEVAPGLEFEPKLTSSVGPL